MITLHPLPRPDIGRVQHLVLPDAQVPFVGPIAEMTADPDLLKHFHMVERSGEPVGFFKLDCDFSRQIKRLPTGALGLRGVLVGGQYQGNGIGTALFSALPSYLADQYPDASEIWLSVDTINQAAIALYEKHGWTRDGPAFVGRSGPECVMRLGL